MGRKIEIPFTGPAYESESPFASSQRCINFYLRPYPEMGENKMALFGTPGLEEWVDLGEEVAVKDMVVYGSFLYVVAGNKLYAIDQTGNVTNSVSLGALRRMIQASTNGVDVTVVNGTNGYVYDITTGVASEISDADFPGGDNIIQVDGYYLVNKPGTGQIYRSDINDGSSWDGLSFSSAGGNPDPLVALVADHRDAYLINQLSTEVWYNTGLPTFNFARAEGAYIEMGGVSSFARTRINNGVYWIGQDENGQGQVFQSVGRVPRAISPPHITRIISSYGDLSSSFMFSYQQDGHAFVVCQFPDHNATWVYDSVVGQWHSRSSKLGVTQTDGRWRANCHASFGGYNLVGDYSNGKIYRLRTDVYDEDGVPIVSRRTAPVIRKNQSPITVDKLHVITEPGVGLASGSDEDVDPQAMIRWSIDAGRNWSPEVQAPLGKIGETNNECSLTQLGQGRNWVFDFSISAAVKRVVLGAVAEVELDED